MRPLSRAEVSDFLQRPLVATLATYRASGDILLSPVWFEWRDGDFLLIVDRGDVKEKHLRRRADATLAVYESLPPYAGVEAVCVATVEDDYAEVQRRMAARYLAAVAPYRGRVPSFLAGDGQVLRLHPTRLRAWSFDDWAWNRL